MGKLLENDCYRMMSILMSHVDKHLRLVLAYLLPFLSLFLLIADETQTQSEVWFWFWFFFGGFFFAIQDSTLEEKPHILATGLLLSWLYHLSTCQFSSFIHSSSGCKPCMQGVFLTLLCEMGESDHKMF